MLPVRERVPARTANGGFTLFEVLIAFFILSVGLTAVISLQGLSKTSQHQAIQRSRAVTLGEEMMEMIRANPRGIATYNIGATSVGGGTIDVVPAPNCDALTCEPLELAAFDLWRWEQALDGAAVTAADGGGTSAGLLQPRGCVVFTADALNGKARTGQVDVVIQWRGLQETSDAVQGGFVCGANVAAADAGFRRQVVISSYVVDELEL